MRKYLGFLLLLSLVSSSCAGPFIDPSFNSLVSQWNAYYSNNQVNVVVEYRDLTSVGAAGAWNGVQVLIDPTVWGELTASGKQQVMFHEFGHAMFGYGHDVGCVNMGSAQYEFCAGGISGIVPRSIMFPWVFGNDTFYSTLNFYYINQLGNCSTCVNYTIGYDLVPIGGRMIRID